MPALSSHRRFLLHRHRTHLLLLTAIAFAFLARVILLQISNGSNDIFTWADFAATIDRFGLPYMYDNVPLFNHPPLMGFLAQGAFRLSTVLGMDFSHVFKLPAILADVLTAILLYKIWQPKGRRYALLVAAFFSWSIVAILVSAYHGNTDSILAFLCLLSAYFAERRKPGAAGLALAAAYNVKLIPLLLAPVFLLSYHEWKGALRFLGGLLVGLLPFVPMLMCCEVGFNQDVLAYNSSLELWGFNSFLIPATRLARLSPLSREISDVYSHDGRYLIVALVLALAIVAHYQRRWNHYELGAMTFGIFLIFTPGFGVQYLVHIVPLLFAVSLSWAALYSAAAGLYLGFTYYSFWDGKFPMTSWFAPMFPMPDPLLGVMTWLVLIAFLATQLTRGVASAEARQTLAEQSIGR